MTRLISLALVVAAGWTVAAQPQADALLGQMRASLERYVQEAPSLVAREDYSQTMTGRGPSSGSSAGASVPNYSGLQERALVSEILMVRLPQSAGWISFRDVMSVDGRALGGRQQRLVDLLQSPRPDALAEARRLASESARYNLGRVTRTLNVPDIALAYLRGAESGRMKFERQREEKIEGATVTAFRFEEITGPTILKDIQGRDLKATGRVWVDATGAIYRTELNVNYRNSIGRCIVDFVQDDALGMRVPRRMTERYRVPDEEVTGVATYSDYRRFKVSTSETVGKPPPSPF